LEKQKKFSEVVSTTLYEWTKKSPFSFPHGSSRGVLKILMLLTMSWKKITYDEKKSVSYLSEVIELSLMTMLNYLTMLVI